MGMKFEMPLDIYILVYILTAIGIMNKYERLCHGNIYNVLRIIIAIQRKL